MKLTAICKEVKGERAQKLDWGPSPLEEESFTGKQLEKCKCLAVTMCLVGRGGFKNIGLL